MENENIKLNEEEFLNLSIGTIESKKIEPAIIKIVGLSVKEIGDKKNKILNCECYHPNTDKNIILSKICWINPKTHKLENTGLWINKDSEGNLNKVSSLAHLLNFVGAKQVSELIGKELNTTYDEGEYLVFKTY